MVHQSESRDVSKQALITVEGVSPVTQCKQLSERLNKGQKNCHRQGHITWFGVVLAYGSPLCNSVTNV